MPPIPLNWAEHFMPVPLFDLTRQYATLRAEIEPVVCELLASGAYVLGPAVDEFESAAAAFLHSSYAVGVANGTDALLIALRAIGLQPGDEVISTPFTFYSAAEVVAELGAKPVFVDIEDETFNLDPAKIEAAITPKTKAIIPVHIFGHPAPMVEIMEIAKKHDLRVIEDCAQSWGATLHGQQTGTWGDAGTFSFFPTKNLGACGEGGLICANDDQLAEKARQLRVHGQSQRYIYDELGYNSRFARVAGGDFERQNAPRAKLERRAPQPRRALRAFARRHAFYRARRKAGRAPRLSPIYAARAA